MSKPFTSHSLQDDVLVRGLREAPTLDGQIDSRELHRGDPLWSEIQKAIDQASAYGNKSLHSYGFRWGCGNFSNIRVGNAQLGVCKSCWHSCVERLRGWNLHIPSGYRRCKNLRGKLNANPLHGACAGHAFMDGEVWKSACDKAMAQLGITDPMLP